MGPEVVLLFLATVLAGSLFALVRTRTRLNMMERRFWAVVEHAGLPPSVIRGDLPPQLLDTKRIPSQRDQRLEQVENRLDQSTDQLDRLAESQDFLARVMVDRGGQLPDAGMRTPH